MSLLQHEIFENIDLALLEKFWEFHTHNPEVFLEFKKLSSKMAETGKGKYGSRTIVEIIRWNYDLQTKGDVFHFNNDFSPLYARLLIAEEPAFAGFFELRKMKPN